jgi:predicted membrane-bound spermidine synthase
VLLPVLFVVFAASGFAGLIYESIWSHYLKLFLGHAAYAQTLVLAIFMGGMALGAWGASRWSPRWKDLLLAYALVEAVIGIAALVFHAAFVDTTALLFDQIIPRLGSPALSDALKWSVGALLIAPQSVLLGATFPLLAGAVVRARPERAGYAIAMLYFTNSLGAAVGVLASGFYFIAEVGLPGTLVAAGIVNLAVALAVILLPRHAPGAAAPGPAAPENARPGEGVRLLLAVAALTGLSSFMYEIGWIRMLALVLGSSTHAFELMLSAFVFGIALGGLWVRRRIDTTRDTLRLLALVQLAMGIAAIATLPVYGSSFHVMRWIIGAVTPSETGYDLFNVASHAIALAVMFPAAFFAGMTLPLITASLLRRGSGEAAIGRVYAANTAGAIAGVLLAVHVGLPWLGVKGLIIAGAAIDLALGVALLAGAPRGWLAAAAAASVAAVSAALFGFELEPHHMASGVYRDGELLDPRRVEVLLHQDGKTSTVSVTRRNAYVTLHVNGKPDGSAREGPGAPSPDEITMTLLGALPVLHVPQARHAAVIGFGTGITSHVLLASANLEAVDTIEIEPAVVRAAQLFRPRNARAYDDPRSRVHYEDAKTYFSSRAQLYDIIVSEPSNPWVSGVATLFSTQFYREVRRRLAPGGLLVQWVQVYEMTPQLLASVLEALSGEFPHYVLWTSNHHDLIVVAARDGAVPELRADALRGPALAAELERFSIRSLEDLRLHRIAGREAIGPYFSMLGAPANTDFEPYVDLNAPKARFMHRSVGELDALRDAPLPLLDRFENRQALRPDPARLTPGARPWLRYARSTERAAAVSRYLRSGDLAALDLIGSPLADDALTVRGATVTCALPVPLPLLRDALVRLAGAVNPHLTQTAAGPLWAELAKSKCASARTPPVQAWLALHQAIAVAAGASLAKAAEAVLEADEGLPETQLPYVVAALMSGQIQGGERDAAWRTFARYRGRLNAGPGWQPVFRFLVAHADAPLLSSGRPAYAP